MSKVISVINDRIKERGVTLVFVSKQAHMKTDLLSKTLNGNRNMRRSNHLKGANIWQQ